jgi:hypothetical protein
MTFESFLAQLGDALASPAVGGVLVVMTGLLLADVLTGVTAGFRTGTFDPAVMTKFLQTHIIGAWVPVVGLVLLAAFTPPLAVVAALAVTAYTAKTINSIRKNVALPEA